MILRMVNICHLRGMLRAIAILQHYYCIKMTYQYCHFFVSILNMLQAANYLSTCIQASSLLHNTCSLPFSWASTFLFKLSNRQGEFVLSEGICFAFVELWIQFYIATAHFASSEVVVVFKYGFKLTDSIPLIFSTTFFFAYS